MDTLPEPVFDEIVRRAAAMGRLPSSVRRLSRKRASRDPREEHEFGSFRLYYGGIKTSTRRELCRLSLARDPDDAPRKPTSFETTDHPAARIDLEAAQAVESRRREGVVVVVPGLTEREPREPPDVS